MPSGRDMHLDPRAPASGRHDRKGAPEAGDAGDADDVVTAQASLGPAPITDEEILVFLMVA